MAMRETVRSLRVYFILSGLLAVLGSLTLLAPILRTAISVTTAVIMVCVLGNLGLGLAFLYVGFSLPKLLRSSPNWIIKLLYASAGWSVLFFIVRLPNGIQAGSFVMLTLTLLIVWYLLKNVRRLAAEAQRAIPDVLPPNPT